MQATPQQYAHTFGLSGDGQAVLDDLIERFGAALYVPGGHEAERQTLVNLGRRQVIDYIMAQISKTDPQ